MIDLSSDKIEWTKRANDEMGLATMIKELYDSNIVIKFGEAYLKYEPRDIDTKSFRYDHLLLNTLYKRHREILLDIVEIFFPSLVFVPSQINKNGSSEFFLFIVIHEFYCITWYQEIENSRPRGYEKEKKKLNEALNIVRGYTDGIKINEYIHFPKHKNEIILNLSELLKKHRPKQGERIIKAIKEYFDIKSLKETKHIKMIKGNRKAIKHLKEEGLETTCIPFKTTF